MTTKIGYHFELGMELSWEHISSILAMPTSPSPQHHKNWKQNKKKMNQDFLIICRIHKLTIWCFPDTEHSYTEQHLWFL